MIDDILSLGKALFDLQKQLRKADQERRQQIAEYFSHISECLAGISEQLESGKVARAKCAELEIYARDLPSKIEDQVTATRARELANQLATAAIARGAVARDLESNDERGANIAKLEEASGVFNALANSIRATPSTTGFLPIPRFVWLMILSVVVVGGIYVVKNEGAFTLEGDQIKGIPGVAPIEGKVRSAMQQGEDYAKQAKDAADTLESLAASGIKDHRLEKYAAVARAADDNIVTLLENLSVGPEGQSPNVGIERTRLEQDEADARDAAARAQDIVDKVRKKDTNNAQPETE